MIILIISYVLRLHDFSFKEFNSYAIMMMNRRNGGYWMKKYNIAGIHLAIHHLFDDYLKDNIEAYEISEHEKIDYTIECQLIHPIIEPQGQNIISKSAYIYRDSKKMIVYNKKGQHIKQMIEYFHDESKITILIDPTLHPRPAEAEYIMLSMVFMEIAMKHRFISIHGAAIKFQEEAIIFSAPSQTGKSTHASYWDQMFSIEWINDDKPLIRYENDGFTVYGSPFSGKSKRNKNIHCPLRTIIFLKQGKTNHLSSLTDKEIFEELMINIMRPTEEKDWHLIIDDLNQLIKKVPIYRYEATHNNEAARILKSYLYQGESHES